MGVQGAIATLVVAAIVALVWAPQAGAAGINYVSASSGSNSIANTLVIPSPPGIAVGDVLVAEIDVDGAPTLAAPAGWTLVRSDTSSRTVRLEQAIYTHVAGAGDPSSFVWGFSAANGAAGGIVAYSGVSVPAPVDAAAGQQVLTSTQMVAPSVTTTTGNDVLLAAFGVGDLVTLGAPAGMTTEDSAVAANKPGQRVTSELAEQAVGAAGPTGTRAITLSSAESGIAQAIALSPDTTPPTTPTGLLQSGATATSVTVGWQASTDNAAVAGYQVSVNGGPPASTAMTSYTASGLSCGASYTLAVSAFDAAGNVSSAASVAASTAQCPDTTPPSTPTGLLQTGATATSVTIGWQPSTDNVGVAGYDVSVNGGSPVATASTSFTASGLSCGTSYTLAVSAFDAAGNVSSVASVAASTAQCPDTTPPSTPTGLLQTGATATSVTVGWQASTDNVGVAGYDVSVNGGSPASTAMTSFTASGLSCGASYTLAVSAFDAAGNVSSMASVSASTAQCPDTTPPSTPTGLLQTGATATSVTIGWQASTDNVGVAGYDVSVNGGSPASTAMTSFTASGLSCGTTYVLAVSAFDAAGNVSSAASVSASTAQCTDTTPPTTPAGLLQAGATATSVTVDWQASTDNVGVAGYDVSVNGGPPVTTTLTSFTATGLSCGTSYTLAVSAFDAAGNVSSAASVSASTAQCTDTTPPTTPAGLLQAGATATSVTVGWQASTDNVGVAGYDVSLNGGSPASTAMTSFTATGLSCGTSYTLAVSAFDAAGNVSSVASVAASTAQCPDTTPPSTPTGLLQTGATATSVTIGWQASTDNVGVAGYDVSVNGGSPVTTASTSYTASGLSCGTSYTLAVSAFDAAGNVSSAASVSASTAQCPDTTPPSTPTGLLQTGATATSVTIGWQPSTDNVGVAGYDVYVDGALAGTTAGTTYAATGISCGTNHAVAVDAFDAAGNRSGQATISATTAACPPPVIASVAINPSAPTEGSTLTANVVASDPSGLPLTYAYQWLVNGSPVSGATGATFSTTTGGDQYVGAQLSVQVTAGDGVASSVPVTSPAATITDPPPAATVALSSATPDTDALLKASVSAVDPDGDAIALTYVWQVNGTTVRTNTTTSSSDTLDLSQPGNGNYGDTVTVQVTPTDDSNGGPPVTATAVVTKPPTGTVLEYPLPPAGVSSGIAPGPDGNVWFSLEQGGAVGRVTPGGTVTEFPAQGANLGGINPGPDGNLWFTETTAEQIARITPSGTITQFQIPNETGLAGIVAGSDGAMWFAEGAGDMIGRIDTSGHVTLYRVPTAGAVPHGVALGPDGNVWFVEFYGNKIGRISPSGTVAEFPLPVAGARPDVITAGPDGNMWFTENAGNKIGQMSPAGVLLHEFKIPTANSGPVGITAGPDGNVWFTEENANKIGRITPSGTITEFPLPNAGSEPDKIITGSDGNLWFTEHNAFRIGRISP